MLERMFRAGFPGTLEQMIDSAHKIAYNDPPDDSGKMK